MGLAIIGTSLGLLWQEVKRGAEAPVFSGAVYSAGIVEMGCDMRPQVNGGKLGKIVRKDDEFLGGSGEGHIELAGVLGDEVVSFVWD